MAQFFFLFGAHPDLSMAEIQSLCPTASLVEWAKEYALFDFPEFDQQELFGRLGGTLKVAEVKQSATLLSLPNALAQLSTSQSESSKVIYGVSVYGWSQKNLHSLLKSIKVLHREAAVKSRFINKDDLNITIPQHLHHLKGGKEYVVVKRGEEFVLADVVFIQDIESYSERDYGKPVRDMRMGMMPPKLAQILLNLAGVQPGQCVWDPFCGGGTLLVEGALMGLTMIGSDLNEDHLSGAQRNIDWIDSRMALGTVPELFQHDVLKPLSFSFSCDAVVFEGDLGPPMAPSPSPEFFEKTLQKLDALYASFFNRLYSFLPAGTLVVAALPFFHLRHETVYLDSTLDRILSLGFDSVPFLVGDKALSPLLYRRPDQVVGRAIYRFQKS